MSSSHESDLDNRAALMATPIVVNSEISRRFVTNGDLAGALATIGTVMAEQSILARALLDKDEAEARRSLDRTTERLIDVMGLLRDLVMGAGEAEK